MNIYFVKRPILEIEEQRILLNGLAFSGKTIQQVVRIQCNISKVLAGAVLLIVLKACSQYKINRVVTIVSLPQKKSDAFLISRCMQCYIVDTQSTIPYLHGACEYHFGNKPSKPAKHDIY